MIHLAIFMPNSGRALNNFAFRLETLKKKIIVGKLSFTAVFRF